MRIQASNKEVAEVLGVTKGTVDSHITALKRKYSGLFSDVVCDE
jgi:DNA-binding CsgD family transcriptional regulator